MLVNRIDANYLASLNTSQPLPDPNSYLWAFDTEAPIVSHADFNDVFMLWYLADPANGFWDGQNAPLLPGYNVTLGAKYNAERASFGGPLDLRHPATGLSVSLPAKDVRNRAAMRWYFEVCDRVNEAVMANCTTAVLQAKWGAQTTPSRTMPVRGGNYDSFTVDGQADKFGWFEDRAWQPGGVSASNVNPLVGAASESFTRRMIHKSRGGLSYYISNQTNPRYISELKTSCGTVSSPVLYRLATNELHGDDGPLGPEPGHQRKNLYMPKVNGEYPVESEWDTAMRLHRHHAEAVINSATASGEDSSALVPWLQMCASAADDVTARLADDFTTSVETTQLLQMLRGKNIKQGLFFTGWYNKGNDPLWQDNLHQTWLQTQEVLKEVYANRVYDFRVARGLSSVPLTSPPPQSPDECSRLEFTLRRNGQDRVVQVNSSNSASKVTELDIDFEWPTGTGVAPPFIGTYDVSVMIECSNNRQNVIGEAYILVGGPSSGV